MNRKYFIALLFSLTIAIVVALGSPSAQAQQTNSQKSIRVIILKDFPPQFITTPDGPSGLAVEMIREVAQRASLKIEFVTLDSWKEVYEPLKNGSVDVLANMGISESRKKIFDFTDPYEVFDIKICVRKETNDIKSIADLKGRLLGVQTTNVLPRGLVKSGNYQIKHYASFKLALLGLLSGEVDALTAPTEPFLSLARGARLDDRIQFVGPSLLETKRAMALPKGRTELRDRLNKSLREFKQTDDYQKLLTKWYGSATPFWITPRLLLFMGIIFAASILVMGIWRYYFIIGFNRRLLESENQKKLIIQTVPDLIWSKNRAGIYLACNAKFKRLYGATETEIIGKTDYDFFDRATADAILKQDKMAIEEKSLTYEEEVTFADDGHKEVMLITKTLMKSVDGTVLGILGVGRDITEIKATLQDRDRLLNDSAKRSKQLEESEKRYRDLFENAEVSIWNEDLSNTYKKLEKLRLQGVIDLKHYLNEHPETARDMAASIRVIHVNEATLKLFGAHKKSALLEQIDKTFGANAFDIFIDELCAIWSKQKVFRSEAALRTLDGKDIQAIISFQIPETADDFRSIPVIIIDITDRKQAEKELAEHREHLQQLVNNKTTELKIRVDEAEHLNKAMVNLLDDLQDNQEQLESTAKLLTASNTELKEFAYIVSHDLKAPLRAISQLTHWIAEDYSEVFNADGKEQMDLIQQRVKRMDGLINGILQYSRIGRFKEKEEPLDLNIFIKEVIESIAPPETLQILFENKLPVVLRDPTRMGQIFQNLIGNAIKFMDKDEGIIKVGCTDEGAYWKFSIADNGPGIDQKYHNKIFQIFQTLTSRDERESTGIGLTLVKKIVTLYGGSVWVESEIGAGAAFFFTLPKQGKDDER